jgi:mRNA interferase MazF
VVRRNDVVWADLGPPAGRRPVCVLTRDAAIDVLRSVTCAPITTRVRGIRSEVEVGTDEGLDLPGAITCDNILTVPQLVLDPEPSGRLGTAKQAELDRALRYALDIRY